MKQKSKYTLYYGIIQNYTKTAAAIATVFTNTPFMSKYHPNIIFLPKTKPFFTKNVYK